MAYGGSGARQPTEQLRLLLLTGSRPIHLIRHRQKVHRFIASPVRAGFDSIRIDSVDSNRLDKQKFKFGRQSAGRPSGFLLIGIWPRQFPLSIESLLLCRSSSSFGRWSTHRFAHLCEPSLRVRPPWNYPCVNTGYPGPPNRPVWTPGLVDRL